MASATNSSHTRLVCSTQSGRQGSAQCKPSKSRRLRSKVSQADACFCSQATGEAGTSCCQAHSTVMSHGSSLHRRVQKSARRAANLVGSPRTLSCVATNVSCRCPDRSEKLSRRSRCCFWLRGTEKVMADILCRLNFSLKSLICNI
jgi:hypothetical protein